MPLLFASRLFSTAPLPERVKTTDVFQDVAELMQGSGGRFYFLGATPAVMAQAVRNVRRRYPELMIAGYRHGCFSREDEITIVDAINTARPDILWIGLGVPAEQSFALRHRDRLRGVGVIKTSGGLFDFFAGEDRQATERVTVSSTSLRRKLGV